MPASHALAENELQTWRARRRMVLGQLGADLSLAPLIALSFALAVGEAAIAAAPWTVGLFAAFTALRNGLALTQLWRSSAAAAALDGRDLRQVETRELRRAWRRLSGFRRRYSLLVVSCWSASILGWALSLELAAPQACSPQLWLIALGMTATCSFGPLAVGPGIVRWALDPAVRRLSTQLQERGVAPPARGSLLRRGAILATAAFIACLAWSADLAVAVEQRQRRDITLEVEVAAARHIAAALERGAPLAALASARPPTRPISLVADLTDSPTARRLGLRPPAELGDAPLSALDIRRAVVVTATRLGDGRWLILESPFLGGLSAATLALLAAFAAALLLFCGLAATLFLTAEIGTIRALSRSLSARIEGGQLADGALIPCASDDDVAALTLAVNALITELRRLLACTQLVRKGQYQVVSELRGDLGEGFAAMLSSLSQAAQTFQSRALALDDASLQLLSATEEQRALSEQQSATLNGTVITVSEINRGLAEVSRSSLAILDKARLTVDSAQRVAQLMDDLQRASLRIRELVLSVRRVSRRSRLLALNASVEAARAGKAGKSIAVLAQEARGLNQSILDAVDEIAEAAASLEGTHARSLREADDNREAAREAERAAQGVAQVTERQRRLTQDAVASLEVVSGGIAEGLAGTAEIEALARDLQRAATELRRRLERFDGEGR